jgi:RNA polymerase sigma-70 factor (ECF subfamily)
MAEGKLAVKAPPDDPAERSLVEAAQRDPRRFGEIYESHFERVYAYVARRVRDRMEAEDLTSEVFHRALAGLGRFEWRGVPLSAWLYRIAAHAIADRARRAARSREGPPLDETAEAAAGGAEREAGDAERSARLFALVDRLPADQRRVIVLRFGEERSLRDVAQELARSEGAVKQLQLRALQRLRSWLGDDDDA